MGLLTGSTALAIVVLNHSPSDIMANLPSIKTLETAFPDKGATLRLLLESTKAVLDHPAVKQWTDQCYNCPTLLERRLVALNAESDGFGVEYISHKDDRFNYQRGLSYINQGDTYTTTIVFDHYSHNWRVIDWGSIIEARPNQYV